MAFILSLPLVAGLISDERGLEPGDFVAAGVFLAAIGVVLELAVRRAGISPPRSASPPSASPRDFGEADDAPGLVLLGILLIVSACALGVRTAQRSR